MSCAGLRGEGAAENAAPVSSSNRRVSLSHSRESNDPSSFSAFSNEVIDDVISAGTAIRESINIIKAHGGNPKAIIVAIDRQEKGQGHESAIQEVKNDFNIDVFPLINLDDVIDFIKKNAELNQYVQKIENYRSVYGA